MTDNNNNNEIVSAPITNNPNNLNLNSRPIMPDDSILYQRQESLGLNRDQSVAIVGAGGVGSWVTLFLGLAGIKHITVYDMDEVDGHNLNRLPYGPDMIGKMKSLAITEHLNKLRPGLDIIPRGNFNPEIGHKFIGMDWVICGTDSLKSRRLVYDYCELERKRLYNSSTEYIEIGAEGNRATVSFSPAEFSSPEEDQAGYQTVPVFVGPCTMAASIVAYYVLLGNRINDLTHLVEWDAENGQVRIVTDGGFDYDSQTEIDDNDDNNAAVNEALTYDPLI